MIPQNSRVPILIDEVLLYGIKVGVWCALDATRIILCVCVCVCVCVCMCVCVCFSINYTYSDTGFEQKPITRELVLLFSNTMLQLT
jgi:hypothetical protein